MRSDVRVAKPRNHFNIFVYLYVRSFTAKQAFSLFALIDYQFISNSQNKFHLSLYFAVLHGVHVTIFDAVSGFLKHSSQLNLFPFLSLNVKESPPKRQDHKVPQKRYNLIKYVQWLRGNTMVKCRLD